MPDIPVEHWIAVTIPLSYAALVAIERCCDTGWKWPPQRGWELLGVACFMLQTLINGAVSASLGRLFPGVHAFDAMQLGLAGAIAVGFLVQTLGNALLHRAYHASDFLWRFVHQAHHAPARMGVSGVMLQSPAEMLCAAVMFVATTRFVLGLDPVATMACAAIASFYGMFQHANLRTPRWLGFVIQRPEQHCEHHRRGVHAGNYSDFPPWDLCWNAFSNPHDFVGELGFGGATGVVAVLAGRDVGSERATRGQDRSL
ncbi:MAG TPA: sterol desaturase family protein [Xanthomonadales bacterium]|nr:sterol desaturase family protein [Xanthomonadales bacterium]